MITIATRYSLDEAFLLRSHLEGSGIPAFIPDEFMANADWPVITALGGVRVQVSEENEEAARDLIASVQEPTETGESLPNCPNCDSDVVLIKDLSRKIALCFLVICTIPLPFFRDHYQCQTCGKRFKIK